MNLAPLIDHTLLKPDATPQAIDQLCQEAITHGFFAVCVPPFYVPRAARLLAENDVQVATVIGFPLGYAATAAKVEEIKRAIDDGADELDVVINICAVKSANWSYVRNDIDSMTRAVHLKGRRIKVILETNLLTEAEIQQVCDICAASGVNFVKTSTGFNGGATVEMVTFLRNHLPNTIAIKASSGIRTPEMAEKLIEAGAKRLGTSSGVQLVQK